MKFKPYPKYKASGVEWLGDVPGNWEIHPGKRLMSRQKQLNTGMHCENRLSLTLNGVLRRSMDDLDGLQTSDFEGYQIFNEDDLVFKLIDLQNIKTSRVGLVHEKGIMSPAYIRIEIQKPKLVPKFAYWLYTDLYWRQIFNGLGDGVRQTLGADELLNLCIQVPSIKDQSTIATFLDRETAKIDTLIIKQENLIDLLKEKRQALISHAVTKGLDPTVAMKPSFNQWIGNVPEHWSLKKLKHLKSPAQNSFVDGPFGSNLKSEHFIDGGDVFVIESNFATQGKLKEDELKTISQAHFETISRSEVAPGDIVIAKIGALFGRSKILVQLSKRAVVSGNSMKFTCNSALVHNQFLEFSLLHLKNEGAIDSLANMTAQPALSLGEMNTLEVAVPSITEQIKIIDHIAKAMIKIDLIIAKAQQAIVLQKEHRTALISAAVTGKIDVREAVQELQQAA